MWQTPMRQWGSALRCWGLALALFVVIGPAFGQGAGVSLTPAQIAQAASPSVVIIRTPLGLGSGFIATSDGKIVTNFHVIQGAQSAVIVTSDKVEHTDVRVVAVDTLRDLAVLKIDGKNFRPLALADSDLAKPGEHVVAIGNPLGLGDTISDGLVSGIRALPSATMLQISAPISPGSSGGPVLNDRGQVIGVSTFVLTGGQNLNFASPINAVKALLIGDKTLPLAAYGPAPRRASIPNHPLSMLNACPAPQLRTVVRTISQAIDVGAPLYNQGNYEACYRVYEGAALASQRSATQCPGPTKALADGVSEAEKLTSWSDKAWVMRDAFDGVLALAEKASRNGVTIERHVPLVSASTVTTCPSQDIAGIAGSILAAIQSGAPLYNDGNIEACYRIYEGAISEIDRKHASCPAARQVLRDGLATADQKTGWAAKAWALRDAFDGLINAIVQQQTSPK